MTFILKLQKLLENAHGSDEMDCVFVDLGEWVASQLKSGIEFSDRDRDVMAELNCDLTNEHKELFIKALGGQYGMFVNEFQRESNKY